jgi:UDP-N-acetyl-D-mannosaminuronic acid dehydrogenase
MQKHMKRKKIAVIGIGRVGLPLALVFAQEGFKIFGIDVNEESVKRLKGGRLPFKEKGALALLKKHLGKRFFPTTDYAVAKKCQYLVLTLGTPVDENMNPSLAQIDAALASLKAYLQPEQTLILRSTVSPGTSEYVKGFLNEIRGLEVGKNFYLAFCPERIAEGKAIEELRQIPQIIGGVDKKSTKKALELFKIFDIKCWPTDALSAELAKLFTNMYRYISFAIANEFAIIAGNYHRDIYEIVNLVNRDYKRGGLAVPGLTGGACLFKDGFFLVNDIPFTELIVTAWKVNEGLPLFLISQIKERMKLTGKKAVILGAAFKANIDDTRESLSFKAKKALERARMKVVVHDPYVKKYKGKLNEVLKDADLVFIATAHDYYRKNLTPKKFKKLVKKNCLICDIWNIFKTNKVIFKVNWLLNNHH